MYLIILPGMDRRRAERFQARMIRLLAEIMDIFDVEPIIVQRYYIPFNTFNYIPHGFMADASPAYCRICKNYITPPDF